MPDSFRSYALRAAAGACALAAAAPVAAQAPGLRAEATVQSEAERYLRVLQVAGAVPLYPWSVRAFSPAEVDALLVAPAAAADSEPPVDSAALVDSASFVDSAPAVVLGPGAHPWADRAVAPSRLVVLRPRMEAGYNSALPAGGNDGAVWAGRGLTVSASAGFRLRAGPLSVRVEPLVYWTENRAFALVPNGEPDSLRFLNPRTPRALDYPQRFGDGAFARVDPGQSTIRLDLRGVAAGVSTANQQWGPAIDQPLLLGASGPGFPHAFVGTARPLKVGIGRVHGRIVWGSLSQSEWSPGPSGHGSRRFGSGIAAVFLPWGLDGLEVGVARFHHERWPAGGLTLANLQRPLEAFYRNSLRIPDEAMVNQVASGFFRWVLPRAGLEFYGELAREDHSFDLLDLIHEPDRSAGYVLGGRTVWGSGARLTSLRAEWLNSQRSHLHRAANQVNGLYGNRSVPQGHTYQGQLLGSPAAYGGGGSVVALDRYMPGGRWSVDWTRTRLRSPTTVDGVSYGVQVVHSLGAEAVAFRGRVDWFARLRGGLELNRQPGEDVFNLSAALGVRAGL